MDVRHIHKGRGAVSNPSGRFEPADRDRFDDGWGSLDEPCAPLETVLIEDHTKTIIARNASPDLPFDRSINPYRGCEHGCIYCFARPSHGYLGLSSGLDFESRIFFKPRAAELLADELSRPAYRCASIAMGTNTDPYQPVERQLGITRQVLEVLDQFHHPVGIVTKGALIQRDIDILADMAKRRLSRVAVSITTLDKSLARRLEPRAASPERRLETIGALAAAGIPTSVMVAPIIPALTDHEMEAILEAARDRGAVGAGYVMLRLPFEIKDLFGEWLNSYVPLRAQHVLSMIREVRHGTLNSSDWHERLRGDGPYAALMQSRFTAAIRRRGLNATRSEWRLDTTQFTVRPKPSAQLDLF